MDGSDFRPDVVYWHSSIFKVARQRYPAKRNARLQAFLNDLGFKGFGVRGSLAHGDPDDKGDSVHVFLNGEHRSYRGDRVGDFARQLQMNQKKTVH
jgi:hypothetical protein